MSLGPLARKGPTVDVFAPSSSPLRLLEDVRSIAESLVALPQMIEELCGDARDRGIHRIADGKLAEHWSDRDDLGLVQQLGVVLMRCRLRG